MVLVGATDAAPSWPPRNHLLFAVDSALVVECWNMGRRSNGVWVSPPTICSTWNGAEWYRVRAPCRSAGQRC